MKDLSKDKDSNRVELEMIIGVEQSSDEIVDYSMDYLLEQDTTAAGNKR